MRSLYPVSIVGLLFLIACSDAKKPNDVNFAKAINQYLTKHGDACAVIGRQFPVDVPVTKQKDQYGIAPELAALEQAGLLRASNTTAVVHGMLDALQGSTPPQSVKRYQLTAEGKKYYQKIPSMIGQTSGFCYGRETVDSIVKWTEPVTTGAYSQTEVTYTYKIVDLAGWAERPQIQHAFPDIRMTVTGALKAPEIAGLQLTNKGWEVPEQ